MPERSEYPPGTPCWVDIGTDVEAAKAFYGQLFGWEARDAGPPEVTGGYGFFLKDGKLAAGYGPKQSPGPPYWATYVCVADADQIAAAVKQAGGTVFVEPFDIMEAGRMGVFADREGAVFSVWEPGEHRGSQLVGEPGSFCWNELNTRDVHGSLDFYRSVFGWTSQAREMPGGSYTELRAADQPVAGLLDMVGRVPDEVPPHWMIYFAVDDCDAAVAAAGQLGGSRVVGPFDIPPGRFAVVRDPQGAHFAVIRLAGR
jgi:predicted enzyme related to lactoylglutathione lyase